MRHPSRFVLSLLLLPAFVGAQRGPTTPPPTAGEARQFDFLVGQWEVTVAAKVSSLAARMHGAPKLAGTWKAWRALDGRGIEDELRITDAAGNPRSLSHSVRLYDGETRRWVVSSLDVYRAVFTESTGELNGTTLTLTSRAVNGEGKAVMSRRRFTKITPTAFRVVVERSADDGKTWDELQTTDAKRVAAVAPR